MAFSLSRATLLAGVFGLSAAQACGLTGPVGDSGFGGNTSNASSPETGGSDPATGPGPSGTSTASQGQGGFGANGSGGNGGSAGSGGSATGGGSTGGAMATSTSQASASSTSSGGGMGGNSGSGGGNGGLCGNGSLDANEQCDDGNTSDGDGCSPTCRINGGTGLCGGTKFTLQNHGDTVILLGDTTNAGNNHAGTCGGGGNSDDDDVAYAVHTGNGGTLTATLSNAFGGSIVYIVDGCPVGGGGNEIGACNTVTTSASVSGNHDYAVIVDGTGGDQGAFTLTLTLGN